MLLNDWATEGTGVLEALLKRPAFRGISEATSARPPRSPVLVLLLDGWNELDAGARKRARVQITALKAELPALGLVVTTRKPRNQALDVPFGGKRIDLLPLSDEQQMQIARACAARKVRSWSMRLGAPLACASWSRIPLFLTALLSLPKGTPFPTTKEEVLRHFVAAHEKEASRAEALYSSCRISTRTILMIWRPSPPARPTPRSPIRRATLCLRNGALLVNNGQIRSVRSRTPFLMCLSAAMFSCGQARRRRFLPAPAVSGMVCVPFCRAPDRRGHR